MSREEIATTQQSGFPDELKNAELNRRSQIKPTKDPPDRIPSGLHFAVPSEHYCTPCKAMYSVKSLIFN